MLHPEGFVLIVKRWWQPVKWHPLTRQEQDACQEKCSIIIRCILGIRRRNGGKKRQRRSTREREEEGELESVKNVRKGEMVC
jgi:hypothetical protein